MTTSRREFFKTAAMGAVGAGAAFGTVAAEAKAAAPSKYDIIILGAGTTVQIEMWYGNGGTERPRSPLGAIWNGVKNNGEKGAEVVRT